MLSPMRRTASPAPIPKRSARRATFNPNVRRQVKRDADALMEQFAGYFAPAGATDREDRVAQELRLLASELFCCEGGT